MRETGWLIEFPADSNNPVEWYGRTVMGLGATSESIDGLRFARQRDAEDFINSGLTAWPEKTVVTEHIWDDGEQSDDYVAYLRFRNGRLQLCDSDAEGAFKVWRRPEGARESCI